MRRGERQDHEQPSAPASKAPEQDALSRREFLVGTLAAGALVSLHCSSSSTEESADRPESPIVFIGVDSFPPEYLALDANGDRGGTAGNWLCPRLHEFLDTGTRFANARCFLPAATDMNHLNQIAGTSSAQTGILTISWQVYQWDADTKNPVFGNPHTSWARDENGNHVDTLFHLVKNRWGGAKTAYVSGKAWIADMYRKDDSGFDPAVDLVVGTTNRPDWVPDPDAYAMNWLSLPSDTDSNCDPASALEKAIVAVLPAVIDPKHFTPDRWTVDAALQVFQREQPDMSVVLLAQTDDAQHLFGSAWYPDEFENVVPPYIPPLREDCPRVGSAEWARYQLVSKRNRSAYREPILDNIREVDAQFGRLVDGIQQIDRYKNATIVVYSDHSHITHIVDRGWQVGDGFSPATDFLTVLVDGGAITEEEKKGKGLGVYSGTSIGVIYFYPDADKAAKVARSIELLRAHEVENPETGVTECPWDVIGLDEMKNGLAGVAAPGEVHHGYLDNSEGRYPVWPDIFLFFRHGWQAPIYQGKAGNVGIDLPQATPTFVMLFGGHGAPDTTHILLAIRGSGIAEGRVIDDPGYEKDYRNADAAVTVASLYGLSFAHKVVGKDRSADVS